MNALFTVESIKTKFVFVRDRFSYAYENNWAILFFSQRGSKAHAQKIFEQFNFSQKPRNRYAKQIFEPSIYIEMYINDPFFI